MQQVLVRVRRRYVVAGAAIVVAGVAAGCTAGGGGGTSASTGGRGSPSTGAPTAGSTTTSPTATGSATATTGAGAAVITATTVGATTQANPAHPVTVRVVRGTLTSVALVNPAGATVRGTVAPGATTWRSTEPLGYAKTYTLTARARDAGGRATVHRQRITTLTPRTMTMPYFQDIAGGAIDDGATYGVGMVVNVRFDEKVADKRAAAAAMAVTTSPHVDGAWYWLDDSHAHWRPQHYYAPGTKVTVAAKVYGVDLGDGIFGEADRSTSFVIGQKRIAIADARTHHVQVFFDGKQIRDMPTSMGRGGYVENGKISLWTMPGNYTVITHENPAIMSSDSYGLPASSPYGYRGLVVPYATKISTDGIYLHQLDSTVGVQGSQNVSHGCLNLNQANAKWYYQHSRVGDVVQVVHSGGPLIKAWQGGDWSVPWGTWTAGGVS